MVCFCSLIVFDMQVGISYADTFNNQLDSFLQASYAKRDAIKTKNQSEAVHIYKPEDYGLTKEGIRKEFHDYITKYRLLE
jgi:hypothetical protein